jgi:hypothetical protein
MAMRSRWGLLLRTALASGSAVLLLVGCSNDTTPMPGSGGSQQGTGGTVGSGGSQPGTTMGSGGMVMGSGGTMAGAGGISLGSGGMATGSGGMPMATGGIMAASGGAMAGTGGQVASSGGGAMGTGAAMGTGGMMMGMGGMEMGSGGTMAMGGGMMGMGGMMMGSGGMMMGGGGSVSTDARGPDGSVSCHAGGTLQVVNSGMTAYLIDGVSNPTLTFCRGTSYVFAVNAPGHPFYIKTVQSTGTGNAYSSGVTGNGASTADVTFVVPADAPATLFYDCSIHAAMSGRIDIVD